MSDVRMTAADNEASTQFSSNASQSCEMREKTDVVTQAVAHITLNGQHFVNGDVTEGGADRGNRSDYPLLVAPVLRVEVLKEEECGEKIEGSSGAASSCSSLYGTDDEAPYSGNTSDVDREASAEQDNDKGEDALNCPFVIPSDELKGKIIAQVEFYFSNANIVCDTFMLKHVKRNKLGFVSLKLVASFRKVKSLSKDHRVVAYCLRQSSKLEVNEEGTKVRRLEPLPEYDHKTASRSIIAFNLPATLSAVPSVESVVELFSSYGDISLVRVLRPGKPLPPDVKRHVSKHPELQSQNLCIAVVEFETTEAATAASNAMTDRNNWRTGLRVVLLEPPQQGKATANTGKKGVLAVDKDSKNGSSNKLKDPTDLKGGHNNAVRRSGGEESGLSGGGDVWGSHWRRSWNGGGEGSDRSSNLGAGDGNENRERKFELELSGTNAKSSNGLKSKILRSSLSPQQDPTRLSPCHSNHSSPKSSPKSSPTARRKSVPVHSPLTVVESVSAGNSPSQSPWVQRRLKAVGKPEGSQLSASAGNSPGASPNMRRRDVGTGTGGDRVSKQLLNVVRQPRGPDGSKGFQSGRSEADESSVLNDTKSVTSVQENSSSLESGQIQNHSCLVSGTDGM